MRDSETFFTGSLSRFMPLQLPKFSTIPFLEQISACARIRPGDAGKELERSVSNDVLRIAKFEDRDLQAYAILFLNRLESSSDDDGHPIHFHVEVCLDEFFPEDSKPEEKDLCDIEEINDEFNRWIDTPIRVVLDARFTMTLRDVPRSSFILPIAELGAESNEMRMSLHGGKCDLEPPPLKRLEWFVRQRESADNQLVVDILAARTSEISESILNDAVTTVLPAFRAFVLGEPDEEAETGTGTE